MGEIEASFNAVSVDSSPNINRYRTVTTGSIPQLVCFNLTNSNAHYK